MTDYPHVPTAFINNIAEEGTKAEAIYYLQAQWNETCALRALLTRFRDHASKNATQWKDGGGSHHHPIWVEVADILGS